MCAPRHAPRAPAGETTHRGPHYPAARRLDLTEELFGHQAADPYRWLEDADSPETRDWLAAQEVLWAGQRAALPHRRAVAGRAKDMLRAGDPPPPAWPGSRPALRTR